MIYLLRSLNPSEHLLSNINLIDDLRKYPKQIDQSISTHREMDEVYELNEEQQFSFMDYWCPKDTIPQVPPGDTFPPPKKEVQGSLLSMTLNYRLTPTQQNVVVNWIDLMGNYWIDN